MAIVSYLIYSKKDDRPSGRFVVPGTAALAMAVIFFVMGALAVLVLLQHVRASIVVRLIGVCAVLVPPAVYVLAK